MYEVRGRGEEKRRGEERRKGTNGRADGDAGDAGAVDVGFGEEGGHDVLDSIARIRRRR